MIKMFATQSAKGYFYFFRAPQPQDTGCNTACLREFLETLPQLEGKEFQVVTWQQRVPSPTLPQTTTRHLAA